MSFSQIISETMAFGQSHLNCDILQTKELDQKIHFIKTVKIKPLAKISDNVSFLQINNVFGPKKIANNVVWPK